MTKAMPLPCGTCFRNSSRASSPPAEAPMPTMGNTFCVLGSSRPGGMEAAGPFFRIFGLDVFFMVGILISIEGGIRRATFYKARAFAALARSIIDPAATEFAKKAHPG